MQNLIQSFGYQLTVLCGLSLSLACSPIPSQPMEPRLLGDSPTAAQSASIDRFRSVSDGIATITERTQGALVLVAAKRNITTADLEGMDPLGLMIPPELPKNHPPVMAGVGSGFFLDLERGIIMTNAHVIDDAQTLQIKLANGLVYPAKVMGKDKRTDIALLQIAAPVFDRSGLKALTFGDSTKLKPGEFVLALGAPFGLEASVSFGVISATRRGNLSITELGDFIQTDAAINPGNSGGPLLNADGELVGVSTAIYSHSGAYNGVGFAIPSTLAQRVSDELLKHGKVNRSYLGVRLLPPEPMMSEAWESSGGAEIATVTDASPAALAGIKAGDVIVEVNRRKVTTGLDLSNTIGLLPPGTKVDITYKRGEELKKIALQLDTFPEMASRPESFSGR